MKTKWFAFIILILLCCMTILGCADQQPLFPGSGETVVSSETQDGEGYPIVSGGTTEELDLNDQVKPATDTTMEENLMVYTLIDFDNDQEKEFAQRGLITAPDSLTLTDANGTVVWSQDAFAFLSGDAPDTVNPSLWRNAQQNHLYGLYGVTEGIYQVRGYDLSNLTLVRGNTGWIVFGATSSVESAQAAMQLVDEALGALPITAVIISHPHADHYGGMKGLVSEEEVSAQLYPEEPADGEEQAETEEETGEEEEEAPPEPQNTGGTVPIIVPQGFTEYAVKENLYVNNASSRRAGYEYGALIEESETGSLSVGIGMTQNYGTASFIKPTHEITETGERITIDGVELVFQLTPENGAPAGMNVYIPQRKALWLADNCSSTLYDLSAAGGAAFHTGSEWASFLTEAYVMFGTEADVAFSAHNWPHFGAEVIYNYMENTAMAYKYIHDQTLLYINQGLTMDEISNRIQLPEDLQQYWYTRQYYGTVAQNSRAVYQYYMGSYDGNPVNLSPLPPEDSAQKFVEYMGDPERVLALAKQDFQNGEYQWVAQITNILVFDDPNNTDARYLCADALEQIGYQQESGALRNMYLSAAYELRNGKPGNTARKTPGNPDIYSSMTPEMFFDYLGVLIDGQAAQNKEIRLNFVITDTNEKFYVHLKAGTLLYFKGAQETNVIATVTCSSSDLFLLLDVGTKDIPEVIRIDGNSNAVRELVEDAVAFDPFYNIIEP
jgi:alkyl sulfatase BDS1-like metallo-beta-lactamase superfamily hydrolase